MVDVLTARVQDMYSTWGTRGAAHAAAPPQPMTVAGGAAIQDDGITGIAMKRMASYQRSQRRLANQELTKQISDKRLFLLKDSPWDVLHENLRRPLMGLACNACNADTRAQARDVQDKSISLRNILQEEFSSNTSFLSQTFKHLAQVYNVRKFDYPTINESVLKDERLREAIAHTARDQCNQRGETSEEALEKLVRSHEVRAKRLLDEMRSKLSDLLLRFTSWVLLKLLPCFLTSVVVHPSQVEMLQKAGRSGLPVIFLPLHRSHLDYILVTFILLNIDVKSPMVAAGDNLKIPVFGGLLRGLGAFFIKRRMDPVAGRRDTVYRAVLHTYMMHSLRAGHNLEFFAEGGRTRTGKACMPKGGLLSVIVDAYMDGTVQDALLVPVSLNYEKLVDGNFTREQMGQPKQMESFTSAIRGIWKTLTSNYGSCRIDFNQPFSLQDMIKSFQQSQISHLRRNVLEDDEEDVQRPKKHEKKILQSTPSSSSLYGTDVVVEEHRQLVESIARHVIHDCTKSTAVMTTNIVSFLLLSSFRDGASIDEIAIALDSLRRELEWAGRDCGFTGNSLDVINYAAELLGEGLVKRERHNINGEEKLIVKPVTTLPNVIELSYYSNGLLSHFAVEAALATALISLIGYNPVDSSQPSESVKFTLKEIMEHSKAVCDILQLEFIFAKPCQNLDSVINDALQSLVENDILEQVQEMLTEEQEWGNRYAKNIDQDSDEDFEESSGPEYRVNLKNKEAMNRLLGRQSLIRPLIDTYIVTAMSLRFLVEKELTERDLMKKILSEVQSHLDQGFVKCAESVSTDTIKNALKLLERWDIVECHTQDRVKLYYLSSKFDNIDSLLEVVNFIGEFKIDFHRDDS